MDDETRRPPTDRPCLLLAGGGTAGHVFPALAVGEVLAARGWKVAWAGRRQGLEATLVRERGLDYHSLPSRPFVGRGAAARLGALAILVVATVRARRLVRRLEARAVVGTGGFVSVPAVLGARLAGRPVLLLEPNARAGVANRYLSRWAQRAAVAYERAAADFRCATHLTGVPVRREFVEGGAPPPAPPLGVLVLGGSQGAEQLNRLLPAALEALPRSAGPLRVLHQVGAAHVDATREAYASRRLEGVAVEVVSFLDDVAGALGDSHLVISRAGAVTLAEICACGRPAILVPLAIAGAHQVDNARGLAESGGAILLAGPEATPERLATILAELSSEPERLAAMGRALKGLARPRAAEDIADLIENLAEAA